MFCFPVWMITTQQTMGLAHSEVDLGRTLWSQIIAVTPIGYHRPICQPHSSQQMYESHARHCMTLLVNKIPPNTQTNYGGWPIEKQCNQFTCFLFLYARLIYKTWLVKYEFWWDKSVSTIASREMWLFLQAGLGDVWKLRKKWLENWVTIEETLVLEVVVVMSDTQAAGSTYSWRHPMLVTLDAGYIRCWVRLMLGQRVAAAFTCISWLCLIGLYFYLQKLCSAISCSLVF